MFYYLFKENLGDKTVKIELKAKVSLRIPCDRCLKEVIVPISVEFLKEMDFKKTEEQRIKDLDDTSYFIGYDLDVDELIYEELLIGFPMKVLCKKDCKGICNICGTDLNQGECGCNRTELDPKQRSQGIRRETFAFNSIFTFLSPKFSSFKDTEPLSACGDVDFEQVVEHTSAITPVPGGVGPMTATSNNHTFPSFYINIGSL